MPEYMTVPWNVSNLPQVTSLKTSDSSSHIQHQLPVTHQLQVEVSWAPSPSMLECWLVKPYSDKHSDCGVMSTVTVRCPAALFPNSVVQLLTVASFLFPLCSSDTEKGCDTAVTHFLPYDQLYISECISCISNILCFLKSLSIHCIPSKTGGLVTKTLSSLGSWVPG